ncbi:MAG: nucleotide sugar dehydrogenase [Alphaproteobacteria bacterium GM202ARS2]|nr:nucleotide sugar dehydrogenase [Alphaproteobacteria bacterium GM202ARS2]
MAESVRGGGIVDSERGVCVVGMGYVGLTLAVALGECGFDVWGVERDEGLLSSLLSGEPHFYEKGFAVRMRRALQQETLHFVSSVKEVGASREGVSVFILTVGTPLDAEGVPRMDMIERVAAEVCEHLVDGGLVILRSTVQVGTTRRVVLPRLEATGKAFMLAYCPERTVEGHAMAELVSLPQVVGGLDSSSAWRAALFFQHMTPTTVRVSSLEAAETIKLLDNSFRDVSFAVGNEVALLCDALGLDGREVIQAANTGYVRTQIPQPGFVGGPCLHKDPHILEESLRASGHVPQLIKYGRMLNESLPRYVCERVATAASLGDGRGHKIAVMGMAFKGRPETSDVRASPSIDVLEFLRQAHPHAQLCAHDFIVADSVIEAMGVQAVSVEEGFRDASAVIIATNNERYQWLEVDALAATMGQARVIFDVWSVLPSAEQTQQARGYTLLRLGAGGGLVS